MRHFHLIWLILGKYLVKTSALEYYFPRLDSCFSFLSRCGLFDGYKSTPNILLEKAYSHLKRTSVINFSQIITIDKSYFIKLIGMLPKQFIEQIDKALISIFNINIKA